MTLTPPYDHPAYKPGDVIVEAMPLIYALDPQFVSSYCGGCFKPTIESSTFGSGVEKLSKCGRCQQIQYCSRECQRFDWANFHKYECPFYAKHELVFRAETPRVVLRCLILMKHRPEELTKQYDVLGGGKRCLMNLVGHEEERGADPDYQTLVRKIELLFSSLELEVEMSEFHPVLCKFSTNSFNIYDYVLKRIGSGLFMETSIFDHSCAPNASGVFDGLKEQVRAIAGISGQEPVTLDYFDILEPKKTRQEHSLKDYFFICQCVRCLSDPSDDEMLEKLQSIKEQLEEQLLQLSQESSHGIKHLKLIVKLYDKLIPLFKQVLGPYHPQLSNLYVNSLELKVKTNTLTGFNIREADEAIKVSHGTHHPFYQYFAKVKAARFR